MPFQGEVRKKSVFAGGLLLYCSGNKKTTHRAFFIVRTPARLHHCPFFRQAFRTGIFGRRIRRQHPLSPQALLSMPLLHTGAARLRYRPQPHACHLPAIACNKPCFSQNSPVLIFAFSPIVCYLQGLVTVALPVWRKVHKRGFASPCQKKAPFFVPSVPAFFRPCFFRLCPAFFGTQRITSVNKTILGLIAAVIVLGAALVLFNNAQKPEAVQNPKTELPALPDLAAERAAKSANLKEVPALPEAVENTASVRAPIVAPNTAPKTAPDNVQGTGEVAKAPVLAAANTAAADKPAARTESTAREQASESHAVARGAVAPRPEAKSAATVAEAKTETAKSAQAETTPEAAKSLQAETKVQAKTETARQVRPAKAEPPQDKTSADREAAEKATAEKSASREEQKQAKPRMVVLVRDKGATVRLNLGQTISYRQMLLEKPDRVVIDVTGSYKDLKAPGIPDNPLVTNVRLGHYDNRTRIVVDLSAKPSSCRVILSEDRDRLDIRVDR